ncbi:glycosyltransferase family 4 protein [Streptomyces sp. NBC_01497]|uniref:glycosyltransferase family 4 protein n=1 Tax=Streptomyces sp. NBC_01497 TaxID=2903885 RepID=UPI002E2EA943|nr:glycosyltransferase family 4 protein [Streptomyces sp. NBC_01497]
MRATSGTSRADTGFTALHLVQPPDGGVPRVVTDLVAAQTAAGLRVVVACPPGSTLAPAAARAGAEVRSWPATREPGRSLPGEIRAAARLLDAVRPDVLHAHSAKAGLAGRLAARGRVPTVFQPHAWSFEAVDGAMAGAARGWERWAARWSDRIVCVSDAERTTGVRAGVRAEFRVVRNGVDTAHFTPHAPPGAGEPPPLAGLGRDGLDLDAGADTEAAPVVVCVGRLCRQKGQDILLRAWDTVTREVPGARLVLVGDGPDAASLSAAAPPSALFTGTVADTARWYRAADLVVLPSRWEGMALSPLEAMACGRPVVLTDVDGARESLPPGHAGACLVPPEDPAALAAAVVALLRDPSRRAALGRQAHDHVLSTFDVRLTAEAVAGVYREVTGAPHHERRERIPQ